MVKQKNKAKRNATRQLVKEIAVVDKAIKQLPGKKVPTFLGIKRPFASAGGFLGRVAGGQFGLGALGERVGRWAGGALGHIFGSGDYTMSPAPLSNCYSGNFNTEVPRFSTSKSGFVVEHREYLQDIIANQNFTTYAFNLQPGAGSLGPWIQEMAQMFEEWEPLGMVFYFKPLVTTYFGQGQPGYVVMSTNYDATQPQWSNKQQMENSEWAVSGRPDLGLVHPIECKQSQNPLKRLYVRETGGSTSGDIRFTDLGVTTIATGGCPNAQQSQIIGELWCTFKIRFYKPRIPNTIGGNIQTGFAWTTGIAQATPLGTGFSGTSSESKSGIAGTLNQATMLGLGVSAMYGMQWTAAANTQWLVVLSWSGTVAHAPVLPALTLVGLQVQYLQEYQNAFVNTAVLNPDNAASCSGNSASWVFGTLGAGSQSVSFALDKTTGVFPSGTTSCNVVVTQIDATVLTPSVPAP